MWPKKEQPYRSDIRESRRLRFILWQKNLDFNAYSPRAVVSDKKWDFMTEYEKNTVRYEDNNWRYWKESKESAVDVSLGSVDKTIRIFTDKYNGYSGRHNFLLNMGYKNYSAGTMTLTFSMPGEYTFDDLYVVCQPMASVEEQTEELGKKSSEYQNGDKLHSWRYHNHFR